MVLYKVENFIRNERLKNVLTVYSDDSTDQQITFLDSATIIRNHGHYYPYFRNDFCFNLAIKHLGRNYILKLLK